jgi:phenylacetate-CoA ligase
MRRIQKITGRTDDMMILRGVNLFPTQIEELILATSQLSPHFQCVLDRSGNLDSLTVVVERRAAVAPDAATEAGLWLQRSVKNTIGVTIAVHVVNPNTVERSVGKMKRIVDNRPAR